MKRSGSGVRGRQLPGALFKQLKIIGSRAGGGRSNLLMVGKLHNKQSQYSTVNVLYCNFTEMQTLFEMKHGGYVYILTNRYNTVLYTGVTSHLYERLIQHKRGDHKNSFSKRYHLIKLVYYEEFDRIENAIAREKQIKAGSRQKKIELIVHFNPDWKDLSARFITFA